MNFLRKLSTRLRKKKLDAEMAEEMRLHLELAAERNRAAGMGADEARYAALREFGNVASVQERARAARGWLWLDHSAKDLRRAVRGLVKSPGFTATALLTLGICLGANVAIFAVVDAVLLRPLPFPDANRLVTMFNTYPKAGVDRDGSSIANYYERRGQIEAFANLALYRNGAAIVGETGSTQHEIVTSVSPEFFSVLGREPVLGRTFSEPETTPGTDDVVVLTDAYWRQHFNADPAVFGRELRVDGRMRKVVGVLAPGFRFLSSEARLYVPFVSTIEQRSPTQRHSGGGATNLVARLNPGFTMVDAQRLIERHNDLVGKGAPEAKMMADAGFRTLVVPLRADHVASIRPVLLLMQAGGLLLLVIGGVNLVNLLLIRASGRAKEIAVRQALGASRRHVLSEVVTETALLALLGGLLGLGIGAGGVRLLSTVGAGQLPLGADIAFDGRLVVIALASTGVLGIFMAVPIAWLNLRAHLSSAMQTESRSSTSNRAAQRLRHGFIVAQISFAFVLLSGAGLLGLSLHQALAAAPGFRADSVLTGRIMLPAKNYPGGSAQIAFADRLLAEIGRQPGVLAAGLSTRIPLDGNDGKSAATAKGHPLKPGESPRGNYSYSVTGDYFATLGISLREGRVLSADDSHRAERVCVVDEDFARRNWPQGGALGQKLFQGSTEGPEAEAFTVVGVVGAVKQAAVTEEQAIGAVYFPLRYQPDNRLFVTIRTSLVPEALAATLRRAVRSVDADLPIEELRSMDARVTDSLMARRSPALLSGVFAFTALLLTAIGTYGVLSYAVSQRHREISVRLAIGARPEQIRGQFLALGLRLLLLGVGLGLLGAILAGEAMRSLLFGVPALHLPTLAIAAAVLGLVSLVACLLPAHRATKIDPALALRAE
ncbi:MAG: ABC transporter permease [Opitutae bacterium]|nr:ABC transporter permease [Opitutae bacterium]